MIILFAAILLVGFITVAVVGVREAQIGVRRLEAEPTHFLNGEAEESSASHPARWSTAAASVDALEDSRFTSSLLALGKAQTPRTHNSPVPVSDELSSSESVLQPLSKSLSQES